MDHVGSLNETNVGQSSDLLEFIAKSRLKSRLKWKRSICQQQRFIESGRFQTASEIASETEQAQKARDLGKKLATASP